MPTRIRTKCQNCDQTVKAKPRHIGQEMRCPTCEQLFVVTEPAEAPKDINALTLDGGETLVIGDAEVSTFEEFKTTDPNSPREQPNIGTLGRFELKEVLGQGGFGIVYRAWDPQLSREVALKVPRFDNDERRARRFLTEAKAAAQLKHPNIVGIYESGNVDGQAYIASEYITGRTLSDQLREEPPQLKQTATWIKSLAEALHYAHSEGVVHRDIKPDNILIDESGNLQIMDFGLAKRFGDDVSMSTMTNDGSVIGTPAYMSPEQARGDLEQVGPQSDQYSLSVIFYELLTGQRPFDGPAHVLVQKVASEVPPSPRKVMPWIPQDLEAVCLKGLEKDPSSRYADLQAMATELDRWLTGQSVLARPAGRLEKSFKWARKNRFIMALLLSNILLLSVILLFELSRISQVMQSFFADTESPKRLKSIALAMHNYHEMFGSFPPAGDASKGELSWRVHLLPFVDQKQLYQQFHLNEPWDSAHNRQFIEQMPELFSSPKVNDVGKTTFHVFTGNGALFSGPTPPRIRDIYDGLSNTILVVQTGPDKAALWTKPGGLKFDPDDPFEALGNIPKPAFWGILCDGGAQQFQSDMKSETLSRLIQHQDGKAISEKDYLSTEQIETSQDFKVESESEQSALDGGKPIIPVSHGPSPSTNSNKSLISLPKLANYYITPDNIDDRLVQIFINLLDDETNQRVRRMIELDGRVQLYGTNSEGVEPYKFREVRMVKNSFGDSDLALLQNEIHMKSLMIRYSSLSDFSLVSLKNMTQLEELDLAGTSGVSDAGFQQISHLKKLITLDLSGTSITSAGLASLKNFQNLSRLILPESTSDAGLVHISDLRNLQFLSLARTEVTDAGMIHLQRLTKLRDLHLNGTQITDAGLSYLHNLKDLNSLYLNNTNVSDAGLSHLQRLTKLVRLGLGQTRVTDKGLEHLVALTVLQENLRQPIPPGLGMPPLPPGEDPSVRPSFLTLNSIDLYETDITDEGISFLEQISYLESLDLRQTKVTPNRINRFKEAQPHCYIQSTPPLSNN